MGEITIDGPGKNVEFSILCMPTILLLHFDRILKVVIITDLGQRQKSA